MAYMYQISVLAKFSRKDLRNFCHKFVFVTNVYIGSEKKIIRLKIIEN